MGFDVFIVPEEIFDCREDKSKLKINLVNPTGFKVSLGDPKYN
jgi:hypothetical protein